MHLSTWHDGPAVTINRGYVVKLDSAYVGWIDSEGPPTDVTLLTVHDDAVQPSDIGRMVA